MKALLLAATSSLALTGFAMAQTATDATTTTDAATASPAATGADTATTGTATDAGMATGTDAATGTGAGMATSTATDTTGMTGTGTAGDMTTGTGTGTDTMGTTGTAATTDMTTTTTDTTTIDTTTTTAPMTTTTDAATVTTSAAPDTAAATAAISAENPGMLGSWIMKRRIWTTNQPSTTAWGGTTLTERPADWTDIAKVDDIVLDTSGNIMGYVADIGGFLGLGAKSVLLSPDALHFVQAGDDAFFATNYTREELEALPDFDTSTVMR